ncbi:MAG: hypothetical protein AAFQ80_15130 [Cyanobacteria bacterium J06621_8]
MKKEDILIEIQSEFRKNIKGAGLIYFALYDLIEANQPVTPEGIAAAVFVPLSFVSRYKYIWKQYV